MGGARLKTRGARVISLAIALALAIVSLAHAQAIADAPEFEAGPKVTSDGLLWSGAMGVSLSASAGAGLLVPNAPLSKALVGQGWAVIAGRRFEAERIGASFRPIKALSDSRRFSRSRIHGWMPWMTATSMSS
jgi:hypothetical protein